MQPIRTKKNTQHLWTKKSHNLSGQNLNTTTSRDKKVTQPLGTKKIPQPLGTKKITQHLEE